ncbi:MAG: phosphatase PAP2 family protein [Erysipelotrichia bacterium]|nr:phosphatase PAP2 family protein [Erysipelotrichia bacterium]
MLNWIVSIDWSILNFIQQYLQCEFLNTLLTLITHLGDSGIIWILWAIILIIQKRYRKYGYLLLLSLTVGLLIGNITLKPLIARDRPCWIENVPLLIANPHDYSFPSGHTLSSVIAAYILTVANRKFGYVAVPLALLIAFSRLYLYVHFPSDVLAAVVIGLIIGYAMNNIYKSIIIKDSLYKSGLS